jgi:hypothetical protein
MSYAASLPVFNKRFVFAHVFLQEVTEGTEQLCQIAFLLFKKYCFKHLCALRGLQRSGWFFNSAEPLYEWG